MDYFEPFLLFSKNSIRKEIFYMIPLNLGARAHDIPAGSVHELTSKLKALDIRTIQFALQKSFPEYVPDMTHVTSGTADYFGRTFQQAGIKINVLGCYVNIASQDEHVRQQAVHAFRHHLFLAKDYQAHLVGSETGSVTDGFDLGNYTEEAYQRVLKSMLEIAETAEKLGVCFGIEAGVNHPIHTAKHLRRLLDDVASPNMKVIFDAANLMNQENFEQPGKITAEAIELLQDEISVIHIKDFVMENGFSRFVPIGEGLMDFTEVLSFVKHHRPMMYVNLEDVKEPVIPSAREHLNRIFEQV